jgi:hypothetical protein
MKGRLEPTSWSRTRGPADAAGLLDAGQKAAHRPPGRVEVLTEARRLT